MRKSKVGSDDFSGIEMRSMKKESTKVFVYFESDSTVEKILKNHSRTIDGRRVNIQQAIVENLKKPTTKKVIRGHNHLLRNFIAFLFAVSSYLPDNYY